MTWPLPEQLSKKQRNKSRGQLRRSLKGARANNRKLGNGLIYLRKQREELVGIAKWFLLNDEYGENHGGSNGYCLVCDEPSPCPTFRANYYVRKYATTDI